MPKPPTAREPIRLPNSAATRDYVRACRAAGRRIGFVPTMGALHDGHLSLVRAARADNDVVIASVYVNPTQFGPGEDFDAYPRDEAGDLAKLAAGGADAVMTPSDADMYPPGHATTVDVSGITAVLEGATRPTHFRGVTTVVARLLNLAQPTRAYFGQKDAQQVLVIQRMVHDLAFDVEIVVCPTVREPDGLAMSSRNAYLSAPQRAAAPALFRGLSAAASRFAAGSRRVDELTGAITTPIQAAPELRLDYAAVIDGATAKPLPADAEAEPGGIAVVAAWAGTTRLIDNQPLG
jgi:pantoate--beta-alanine ligase